MSGPAYRTVKRRASSAGLKSLAINFKALRFGVIAFGALAVMASSFLAPSQAVAQSATGDSPVVIQSSGAPLTQVALGAPSDRPQTLKLAIGRAQLLRLPVDVKDVIVSSSTVADVVVKSPRLVYMLGQQSGSTSVIMLDASANIIYNMNIIVAQELSSLQAMLKTVLPEENISVTSVQGNILMTGKVRTSYAASYARDLARRFVTSEDQIINRLQVLAAQQVMLRVRVAEVRRTVTKSLGLSGTIGQAASTAADGTSFLSPLTGTGVIGPQSDGTIKFGLFAGSPFNNLALALDALETEGLVRTLAEPNLTSLSGEHATFLAGGEIPVPAGVDRNGNLTIRFRDFGVELDFTPTVLDTGRINLKVRTSVSEVDTSNSVTIQGVDIPGFRTRRAQTTVEMASGGGLVIGGLLQNDLSNSQSGFPGLVDIPIIGALFRSTAFSKAESELVVTVSAYLVRPVADQALVLPTDGFAASSDADMFLLGRLHAHYGRKGTKPPKGKPKGPVGFVME